MQRINCVSNVSTTFVRVGQSIALEINFVSQPIGRIRDASDQLLLKSAYLAF